MILNEMLLKNLPKKIHEHPLGSSKIDTFSLTNHNSQVLNNLHGIERGPEKKNPTSERTSVRNYTTDSYDLNVNHLLKNDNSYSYLKEHSDNISNYIGKKEPLTEPISVFSGLRDPSGAKNYKKGDIFHHPTFISTSLDFVRAHVHSKSENNRQHILHFKLPKGYNKGSYIAHLSQFPKENEFLLDKNQKWKIIGKTSFKPPKAKMYYHIWHLEPHENDSK